MTSGSSSGICWVKIGVEENAEGCGRGAKVAVLYDGAWLAGWDWGCRIEARLGIFRYSDAISGRNRVDSRPNEPCFLGKAFPSPAHQKAINTYRLDIRELALELLELVVARNLDVLASLWFIEIVE